MTLTITFYYFITVCSNPGIGFILHFFRELYIKSKMGEGSYLLLFSCSVLSENIVNITLVLFWRQVLESNGFGLNGVLVQYSHILSQFFAI